MYSFFYVIHPYFRIDKHGKWRKHDEQLRRHQLRVYECYNIPRLGRLRWGDGMNAQPVRDILQLLHGLGLGLMVVRHDVASMLDSGRRFDVEWELGRSLWLECTLLCWWLVIGYVIFQPSVSCEHDEQILVHCKAAKGIYTCICIAFFEWNTIRFMFSHIHNNGLGETYSRECSMIVSMKGAVLQILF